jgi:hypothetical protein
MDVLRLPGRVSRHVVWRVGRMTTATLDAMRRGDRTLIRTPQAGLRFGNWLYLWLDAHQRTVAGKPTVILAAPGMDIWLEAFPALKRLTVSPELVRFHDRREWDLETSWKQRFDLDFTRQSLNAFILDCLAPSIEADDSGMLVINVRRGDYYSNPGLRERYGFDQLGYLKDALAKVGHVDRALIVSDDPDWCRDNLLGLVAAQATVDFAERDPVSNFKAVAGASRIIGTNSTFTYWAAYISGALHPSPVVVMPRFHARLPQGSEAYQLDPSWIAIDGHF